jgi:hypothetical protein
MARQGFHQGFTLATPSQRDCPRPGFRPSPAEAARRVRGYLRETTDVVQLLAQHDPLRQKEDDMDEEANRANDLSPRGHRRGRQGALLVAGLLAVALLAAACGSGSPNSPSTTTTAAGSSGTSAPRATTPTTEPGTSNRTGVLTHPGSGSGGQTSSNRSAGTFTRAFAECMRAHGVPTFPNPNGTGNQLGPDSGANPASLAFQAAVEGPCRLQAPAGWVSSGPLSKAAGS